MAWRVTPEGWLRGRRSPTVSVRREEMVNWRPTGIWVLEREEEELLLLPPPLLPAEPGRLDMEPADEGRIFFLLLKIYFCCCYFAFFL